MKVCPVCSARCFDDMEVCYGCLHAFSNAHSPDFTKGGEDDGFGEFDPDPASDQVVQQVVAQSLARSLPDHCLSEGHGGKHCFTAQIGISCTNDESIDVNIRIPSEAIRMLQRV